MRSIEMKNRCLLYYGNPVGYRTEQGVVADCDPIEAAILH